MILLLSLVCAFLIIAIVALAFSIASLIKINKLEKEFNGFIGDVQECFDDVSETLNISADIAEITRDALNKLRENDEDFIDALEEIDYDFTCLREDVDTLDRDMLELCTEFFSEEPEEAECKKCEKEHKKPGRPKKEVR